LLHYVCPTDNGTKPDVTTVEHSTGFGEKILTSIYSLLFAAILDGGRRGEDVL
jgi:hypothetical protein